MTVAALPPAATFGHGARVPFLEYEAETAQTNGRILGPDRTFGALAAEASGRRAVELSRPGDFVEFVLAAPANALTLRYAVPDSANGSGRDAQLAVRVDGALAGRMRLTSRYGWFYGRYPFSNDPRQGRAHHMFDEARLLLGVAAPAGARVRLEIERGDASPWVVLDVADFERVGSPAPPPPRALSVKAFGADASGLRDSRLAIQRAIQAGRVHGRPVYLGPGHYRVEGHLIVDRVQLIGAGPWWSVLQGRGVGVFSRPAPSGSQGVTLRDFAIEGEVTDRNDHAKLSGVGGAMSDSVVSNLFIHHTKGGLWFDGPLSHLQVRRVRVTDQTADGLNFHRGVTDSSVEDSFFRNTGDDGLASWSNGAENARIVFRRNTVIAPNLANGIALYGGRDLSVESNVVADSLTEGGGLHLGARFKATPVAGRIVFSDNDVVRSGSFDPHWRTGVGAVWIYALERPMTGATILFARNTLIDSSEEGLQLIGKAITGASIRGLRIEGGRGPDVQLQAPGAASLSDLRSDHAGPPRVVDCGFGFRLVSSPPLPQPERGSCAQ